MPTSREPPQLSRNALPLTEIVGSTLANVGPALGVLFNFGLLAQTAGVAMPLVVLFAMAAVLFLCNTLAQFSRFHPSAGSLVTFLGLAFGPAVACGASLFVVAGYCAAASGIVAMAGGWTQEIAARTTGAAVPWAVPAVAASFTVGVLVWRGVSLSTRMATLFFGFEAVLLATCTAALFLRHRHFLSFSPMEPSHVAGGLRGFGLAFPFGVYLFVGWENAAMLAEEAEQPRRNVPRALFIGTLAVGLIYLVVAYAVEIAFHEDAAPLARSDNPFLDAVRATVPQLAALVYAAGATSLFSCLIGLTNAQGRILFDAGRRGMLPRIFGRVHAQFGTPHVATACYVGAACATALLMGSWAKPLDIFNEAGTLGTLALIVTYMLTNLALPVYVLRRRPTEFRVVGHLLAPLCGTAVMLLPAWGLVQPGQPVPYNLFPWLVLGAAVIASGFGVWRAGRFETLRPA